MRTTAWLFSAVIAVTLAIALDAAPALAGPGGHEAGGGHVVVCRTASGAIQSIELLDYYEGRQLWGMNYDLSHAETYHQKFEVALSRLRKIDPARAARYKQQFQAFESDSLRQKGITLVNLPDTGNLAFPANCQVEQMITQATPEVPEDHRYLINQDLWESPAFDEDNREGIILHELIYREAIEAGQTNSRLSRYFNAYISSNKIAALSQKDYLSYLQLIQFPSYLAFGWFNVGQLYSLEPDKDFTFFPNGQLHKVIRGEDGMGGQTTIAGQPVTCEPKSHRPVWFYPNGNLQACWQAAASGPTQTFTLGKQTLTIMGADNGAAIFPEMYPDGSLKTLCYFRFPGYSAKMRVQGVTLTMDPTQEQPTDDGLLPCRSLAFFPSGNLQQGFVVDPVALKTTSGTIQKLANQFVYFDESGLVTRWDAPPAE